MLASRKHIVVTLLIICLGADAFAGKLGSLREKTRHSKPAPAAKTRRQESSSRKSEAKPRKENDDDDAGVLSAVRATVRSPSSGTVPSKPKPRRRPPRPRHTGVNVHFRSGGGGWCPAPIDTTIVEHHYYVTDPPVVVEPILLPPPSPTPVMPPAPIPFATESVEPAPIACSHLNPLDPFQVRFELDYGDGNDGVSRTGFGLLAASTGGLGIDTGVRIFRERNQDFRDHLWIGDVNLVWDVLPSETMRTRVGIGVNWLADQYGGEAGLNLTVGSDIFAGPLVFSGELDSGTLGDADLLHGRVTVALRQGENAEWFAGYDYLDVGGVEIHGVLGGLRFRF